MADWTQYETRPILGDWTVPLLAAGATVQSQITGTRNYPPSGSATSTIKVTTNSIAGTNMAQNYVADGLEVEITPPQMSSGAQPDCVVWFGNGTQNLDGLQYIDASLQACMFPRAKLTRGLRRVSLGVSMRDADLTAPDVALKITGLKITTSVTLYVYSVAGWTSPLVPLRVVLRGDMYSQLDLQTLGSLGYNGGFSKSALGFGTLQGVHQPKGVPGTTGWFASLPGGNGQGATKINRKITFAYNAVATTAAGVYVPSQESDVLGIAGNVASAQNDLADVYGANSGFIYTHLGLNLYAAGSQAYFGLKVGNTIVPQDTPNGTYVTAGNDDFAYGAIGDTGEFYGVVPAKTLVDAVATNGTAVPVVASANQAIIAANDFSIAKIGVEVLQA